MVVECNKRRPNSDTANVDIGRWLAEPVSMVTLGEDVWLQNAKGFPVLGKVNQSLVHTFMRVCIFCVKERLLN